MGVGIKVGGIVITGIFGFYLINKAMNHTRQSIHEITEASKWKAYYKNGHMGRMVPPGYVNHYHTDPETGDVIETVDHTVEEAEKKAERKEADKKPVDFKPIADAIEKVSKAFLKTKGIDIDKKDNCCGNCHNDRNKSDDYKPVTYSRYYSDLKSTKDILDSEKSEDLLKDKIDNVFAVDNTLNPKIYKDPYEISSEEFNETDDRFDKVILNWYDENNITIEEISCDPITDISKIIGCEPEELFSLSSDDDEMYVRNEELATDCKIVRYHTAWDGIC